MKEDLKNSDIFEKIFINIVEQAINFGLVKGDTFFTDSTHKKANANKNKFKEELQRSVKKRRHWLEQEINEERKNQGKRNLNIKMKLKKRQ